jgi:hypothetical protein
VAVLVTAAATALGLAVVVSPAADAAKPAPPPPTGQLTITSVYDDGLQLPGPAGETGVGYVVQGEQFTITVAATVFGTPDPLLMQKDTVVTVAGGGFSGTVTILRGDATGTGTGTWGGSSNLALVAKGPRNSGLADSEPYAVTVGVESYNKGNIVAGAAVSVATPGPSPIACSLGTANPTCLSLSVASDVSSAVLLSTSECATFLTGATRTGLTCPAKGSVKGLVGQAFVELNGVVATAVLSCDKSLCGNGGVSRYVPQIDETNDGTFSPAPECPSKGTLGPDQHVCFDSRASTRDNAGDLFSVIIFDRDLRMSH